MNLTDKQLEILDHMIHRASQGLYCGASEDMDILLDAGLVEYAGKKSFVPDKYYRITSKGREILKNYDNTR